MKFSNGHITVFTHPHRTWDFTTYRERLNVHKQLNHKLGFDGTLLFTSHNDLYDPWVSAQWLCEGTNQIPLIAVNPIYLPPFVAARKAFSLMSIYKRDLAINWITGTSKNDLAQLGDQLDKQARYKRLSEYIEVFHHYLSGKSFSFQGEFFELSNASMSIPVGEQLTVKSFIAGNSSAVSEMCQKFNGIHLQMLPNPNELDSALKAKSFAFGVILGKTKEEARERAIAIFAKDRIGEKTLEMALTNTDSSWKHDLAASLNSEILENGYWTKPLQHFSEVPFMVTSIEEMKIFLSQLQDNGAQDLIVSLPTEQDYHHLREVFN